uniref:Uncharacterized protein n=1 Tax=candidate division CPR3 bacterium TaxID=2268181 RepID=A0A7C4M0W3_UNCC3
MNNKKIEKFIKELAKHEREKISYQFEDSRNSILVTSGLHLNWIGDFFSNPKIKWEEKEIAVEKIKFTGTNPKINDILLNQCHRSPKEFRKLIKDNPKIKKEFEKYTSFGNEPILVRKDEDNKGYYKVLDGMHRFVGASLSNKPKIKVWLPINEDVELPYCEPHVVYDLMRGYMRHAKDKEGQKELYYALKLLNRTYANVKDLLKGILGEKWVFDKDVQKIIKKVLKK